ncbi:unnamed protein product, partial [Didymodactylos carnosus]
MLALCPEGDKTIHFRLFVTHTVIFESVALLSKIMTTSKYFTKNTSSSTKNSEEQTVDNRIIRYLESLEPPLTIELPKNVEWLYPLKSAKTRQTMSEFFHNYYSDSNKRILIIGINCGRFGAGITGVPFTDPIRLKTVCNIDNHYPQKAELSSIFVYQFFDAYGGVEKFCQQFFIGQMCPL